MCGRFVASRPVEEVVEEFGVDEVRVPEELLVGPRFNVAPQAEVLGVREIERRRDDEGRRSEDGDETGVRRERRLGAYRWGLVPSWAKDPSLGARAFNARAETLLERPMFRSAVAKRRLIIPADAFYEWQRLGGSGRKAVRQPWCFRRSDGHLIGFAGLYELWRPRDASTGEPEGAWLRTCTIITTEANTLMAPIHDRMPVVLCPEQYEQWLAPGPLERGLLARLLAPAPEGFLAGYEVSREVSDARSEGPQLAEPLGEHPAEP